MGLRADLTSSVRDRLGVEPTWVVTLDPGPRQGHTAPMTRRPSPAQRPILALLGLVLLPALILAPALVSDRALVGLHTGALSPWRGELDAPLQAQVAAASQALQADKTIQFWPLLDASLERLSRGQIPHWNPLNLGGVPLLAQGFQGTFHPPNWLALLLPYVTAFAYIAWLQVALAGLCAFGLLRSFGAGCGAALLGGSTWMFCGYLSARWHWYQIQGCAAYLPLALWSLQVLTRDMQTPASDISEPRAARPTRAWTAVLGLALAVGLSWLTGWAQGALHLAYAAAAFAAVRVLPALRASAATRRLALICGGRATLGLVLGMCLAAPQLLPTLGWVASGESARDVEPVEVVAGLGMEPLGLLGILSPDNLGHPRDLAAHPLQALTGDGAVRRLVHKPNGNFVETSAFVGVLALLLAALGAARASPLRALGVTLSVLGLVLAVESPLLLGVARLPGLASGDPLRFLSLFCLGAALLAGAGWGRLACAGAPLALIALAALLGASAGLAGLWLRSLSEPQWAELIGSALARRLGVPLGEVTVHAPALFFDHGLLLQATDRLAAVAGLATLLLLFSRRRPALAAACVLALALGEQAWAASRSAVFVPATRLFELPPRAAELADGGRLMPLLPRGQGDLLDVPFPGNTALPANIDDLSGYWALAPRRMVAVLEGLQPGTTFGLGSPGLLDEALLASPVLELLAVNQVVSADPVSAPGWHDEGPLGDAWLLLRDAPAPVAWFSAGRAVADDDAALAEMLSASGDLRSTTPLSPVNGALPPTHVPSGAPAAATPVMWEPRSPEHGLLHVYAPAAGVVVLSHAWHPDWQAAVDGEPAVIWPAWHTLRAVEVSAGPHVVELRYRSRAWAIAAPLGALGLAGLLAVAVLALREQRSALRTD